MATSKARQGSKLQPPGKKAKAGTAAAKPSGGRASSGSSRRVAKNEPSTSRPNPEQDATFDKIRDLCLALPDTKLTLTWGQPHFRVGEKIFCGFGEENGKRVLGVKLEPLHARERVKDPRFWPAPYVGKHGWVSMNVAQRKSWSEVDELIRESYGLVAGKRSRAKLTDA